MALKARVTYKVMVPLRGENQKDILEKHAVLRPMIQSTLMEVLDGEADVACFSSDMEWDPSQPHLEVGPHQCPTSPIDLCEYDPDTDPGWHDDCIHCHEPEERK